jgi:hypothetical protein
MTTATADVEKLLPIPVRKLREAQAQVEKIKNDEPQNFPEAASIGDAVRQGDIYIQLISPVTAAPFLYNRAEASFPMQLADGETKGSRHCLEHGHGVTVYKPMDADSQELIFALAEQHGLDKKTPNLNRALRQAEWSEKGKAENHLRLGDAMSMLAFAGPIFTLTETNTVTHPEHGDWVLPPGSYRVTYQRTVTLDNTVTRVLD